MSTLSLAQANQIIDAAIAQSNAHGYKPMAVVVLDVSGHVKAIQREDGASMFRVHVATGKAWGAVGMGASSRVLGQRAKDNPNFYLSLASTAQVSFCRRPERCSSKTPAARFWARRVPAAARAMRMKPFACTASRLLVLSAARLEARTWAWLRRWWREVVGNNACAEMMFTPM